MKKMACFVWAIALLGAVDVFAGSAGVSDPTITVNEFTRSGGFQLRDKVHASLDSLDTAVEATIDVVDGLVDGTQAATLTTDKLYVGNDSSNRTEMGVASASDVSMSQDGTNVTITLDDDVVAAAEMADADHGEISWSSGAASVDSEVIDADNLVAALADHIAYVTVTGADLASAGTGTITIQLKDADGNNLSAAALVRTWIGTADDYGVDALTDYSVSTGTQKEEVTANGEYLAITDGSGTIVMAVDYAGGGAGSVYAWAEVGGRIVASGEVALTAP